ncbi:MAG: aminotransferase class I/II-fold pyridoxal phosphate-dependent enzyme [Oscillospiraceae bacterium]|nr:aminotransferase class I/II-fold pyridoxal phosphate-dependent enzyme [Oscillospiraceae bacterium]
MTYLQMSREELQKEYELQQKHFADCKAQNLKLNMARGKPGAAQLDLVSDILSCFVDPAECFTDGIDGRNYGELAGLPVARKYWADVLGCKPEQTFIGGASSLNLMFDIISRAFSHGLLHSPRPWSKEAVVKFLCPSPGYDRHFKVTEFFGAELITVPMTATGPDMDVVEDLVKDPLVKGIWCVPKYSNPDGIIYSEETINRFANLKPAAPDFTIMWDNAYCVHEFEGEYVPFPDIISLCEKAGNPDMVYEFASTSKITFPGAGFSVIATSEANIQYISGLFGVQTISYDKINQLRHVKYLKDKAHTLEIMKKHATVLGPKFGVVADMLDKEIAPCGFAQWNRPMGGYFVSLNTMHGTAKRALSLCKEAGVVMTSAGATFPYGNDPQDSNIRIAPSLPPVAELEKAMDVFCTCLKLAALEKLLEKN